MVKLMIQGCESMVQTLKKSIRFVYDDMLLPLLCFIFFVLAFCFEAPIDVFKGYISILLSKSILITDYIAVGGLGATFLNVSTILLFNMIVIKKMKLTLNGPIFAGLIMILGFSFFGKNLVNTLPIYFGIYLYTLYKKSHFKNYIITVLFSTGISPLVSYTMFSINPLFGIPLGILAGTIVGFLLPVISTHAILFHKGYNLFNTGFALGIISMLFYGLYSGFGLEVVTEKLINDEYHYFLLILLTIICFTFIIVSFIANKKVIKDYLKILPKSGRLVSDFIREGSKSVVLFNFGILGLLALFWTLIFDIRLNGATFGTIISVIGFASFGIHIKNALPIWIGAIIGVYALGGEYFNSVSTAICFFFCLGLAPIAGKY